jgi:8-oxo-dGTP diphosphatase
MDPVSEVGKASADIVIGQRAIGDGVVVLHWAWSGPDAETLLSALREATEAALAEGFRRVEVMVPAADRFGRRAALRSGFRQEGVRRQSHPTADGWDDLVLFARLAGDVVGGPTGFSGVMNSALPRKRLIAHVLFRDGDRLLLCETRFKADWELPGGIVEPDEPPHVGAAREVVEELGIERPIGRLLVADWMPPYLGWDDALELIFDGGALTESELDGLTLEPHEIVRVRLCTLPEAGRLVTALSHRRLSVAVDLAAGETAYLQNGYRLR